MDLEACVQIPTGSISMFAPDGARPMGHLNNLFKKC